MRNPNWTEEELVLALDLYFRVPSAIGDNRHPEVESLSAILNRLGVHPPEAGDRKFRNGNGVATKLSNFRAHDPKYPGTGLSHGSKLERVLWDKYAENIPELQRRAREICEEHGIYSETRSKTELIRNKLQDIKSMIEEIEHLIDEP